MRMPGNPMRRMTVGDRARAGIGAVGPRHPKMLSYIKESGSSKMPVSQDETEPDDNPQEESGEPPNFRDADCCGTCTHFDGEEKCTMHDTPTDAMKTCDDHEMGGGGTEDSEQGAAMSGDY